MSIIKYFSLVMLMIMQCFACQMTQNNYLELLPKELWQEVMQFILSPYAFWQDMDENNRIDCALHYNAVAHALSGYDFQHLLVARMRSELAKAKSALIEPYQSNFIAFTFNIFDCKPPIRSPWAEENPKLFRKLLPLKSILSFCDIDQEWLKEFLVRKGNATLRKHMFIAALKHRHEYLVNYLWNSKYRRKIMMVKTSNMGFLSMAHTVANRTNYETIANECKRAYDLLKEERKAAIVYHPG